MITKKIKESIENCKCIHGTLKKKVFPCYERVWRKDEFVYVWSVRIASQPFSNMGVHAGSYRTTSAYQTTNKEKFCKMVEALNAEHEPDIFDFGNWDDFDCKSADPTMFNLSTNK